MSIPPEFLNQIVTGDARELSKRIPDESIDLIFTDPVYWQIADYEWISELGARVLKTGGDLLAYSGQYDMAKTIAALGKHLAYRWVLIEKKISPGALLWSYRLMSHYIPLLWFTKGTPRYAHTRMDFQWAHNDGPSVNHDWGKGITRIVAWLDRFANDGDILLDPFCGGGSILAGAKSRGVSFVGFEIDPLTAQRARERVANTQVPLFVLQPTQLEMLDTRNEK